MKNKKVLIPAAVALVAVIVILIVWAVGRNRTVPEPAPAAVPSLAEPDIKVVYKEKEKLVEVEKTVTAKIIQDKLRDMGFMVTQEYWFSEVMSYSSAKDLFGVKLPFTESNFIASYEGSITAGVDFTKVNFFKNDTELTVTVIMPEAELLATTIDNDSFKLYSEKEGIGNNISLNDYNVSVINLKKAAEQKAVERGVLDKASENAERIIRDVVDSLVDTEEYAVTFQTK